jgi:aldehyde:ferredoxin oxidoreductase
MGSALAWALELYQRGIITTQHTGGLELKWGDAAQIEQLLFMTSRREGFGDVLADSARAVERGHYPPEALKYRKAFALGLAVATRGMDHLRNRVTLEINAKINDDPDFKAALYGGPVSAQPNSYADKERAVRACENMYAVGDAVGMCRFTTRLFNSPSLPGLEEFQQQLANVTGLQFTLDELNRAGQNIMGVERMINHRLGVRRTDDTLPDRWFDEPNTAGPFKGERIDRDEFARMLARFYEISELTEEGVPREPWRSELLAALHAGPETSTTRA